MFLFFNAYPTGGRDGKDHPDNPVAIGIGLVWFWSNFHASSSVRMTSDRRRQNVADQIAAAAVAGATDVTAAAAAG